MKQTNDFKEQCVPDSLSVFQSSHPAGVCADLADLTRAESADVKAAQDGGRHIIPQTYRMDVPCRCVLRWTYILSCPLSLLFRT